MGYRSDIAIVFIFKKKEQIDEVLAVYQMHPFVQANDLTKEWKVHDWGNMWGMTYYADGVKWYDNYEDVQSFEYMEKLVKTFADERGVDVVETHADGTQSLAYMFPYAYRKIRIGEEDDDNETDGHYNDVVLTDELYERVSMRRELITNF
jgi:hypothetical protein